jgi:hypothetical protein
MLRLLAVTVALALPTAALAEEAGGLTWTAPKGWALDVPRPMRAATYRLPTAKGDTQKPELAVFYFGQGQGGAVDANVTRWANQFQGPDGKPVTAKSTKEKLAGLPVTLVEAEGTYAAGGMGMGPKEPQPGFALLGAIVEGPQGAVFFKMTGPRKSVAAAKKDLRKLLTGIKAQ